MAYKPLVNPVVANVSPNIYEAAQNAPISAADRNTLEQMSFAYTKGTQLKRLSKEAAIKQFSMLTPEAQNNVRYLFPNDPFVQPQQDLLGKIVKIGKQFAGTAIKVTFSPLVGAYSAMGEYTKAFNTPARVSFQTESQGKPLFSGKTWSDAYNGVDLYNQKDLDFLDKKYGKEVTHVAKGLVAGQTPGEIFASWNDGKPDPALFQAYSKFLNDPKNFSGIMDEVKLARFAPGRSLARQATGFGPEGTNPNPVVKFINRILIGDQLPTYRSPGESDASFKKRQAKDTAEYRKKVSGIYDGMYQILADPMTYATLGLNKVAMGTTRLAPFADKIASAIQFSDLHTKRLQQAAANGTWEETVADVFSRPQVKGLWDETAGPAIRRLAEAAPGAERAEALNNIRRNLPAYNDPDALRSLVKAKVFDAKSAEAYFTDWENAHLLISGRTDNTTWYRNGIATARNQRQLSQGIALAAEAIFNPVLGKSSARKTIEELDKEAQKGFEILSTLGKESDNFVNPGLADISLYDENISKAQKLAFKLGNLAARNQGNGFILLGDDAWRTANSFYLRARTVFPTDVAKAVTDYFVHAPFDEQFNAVYNLYAASMANRGVEGVAQGRNFSEEILKKMFNLREGFGVSPDIKINPKFAAVMSPHGLRWENNTPGLPNRGALQPSQLVTAIAPLNDAKIAEFVAYASKWNSVPAVFDGVTQSKALRYYTNFWSFLNLFPRLGLRTSADHITFYIATAPKEDLLRYLFGGARREGKFLNMVTGSKEAVGPGLRLFHKTFKRGGAEDYLTEERRNDIISEILADLSKEARRTISIEEVQHAVIRTGIAQRAHQIIFGKYDTPNVTKEMLQEKEALINLFKYDVHSLDAQVSSLSARASMNGAFVEEAARKPIFTESALDKALKYVGEKYGKPEGFKVTGNWGALSAKDLRKAAEDALSAKDLRKIAQNDDWLALAHHQNWTIRFVHNSIDIPHPKGYKGKYKFSPINAFFNNNGIETEEDFINAIRDMMNQIGVSYKDDLDYIINDDFKLAGFLKLYAGATTYLRDRGLSDVQIARIHLDSMLADMQVAFHGSQDIFNYDLYNAVKANYDEIAKLDKADNIPNKWAKAAGKIEFEEFMKLTDNYRPQELNTSIEFPGLINEEMGPITNWLARFGYGAYEQMDRQVNGWFTQKALTTTYLRVYKNLIPFRDQFAKQQERLLAEANPSWGPKYVAEVAKDMADRRYTTIAITDATNILLKYVDNQAIRSNFAVAFRTLGRYYRANEDFMRRVYRMIKDKPLSTLYRIRLTHTGIDAYGGTHQDENGKDYIIFPSDTVFNHAVAPVFNTLWGADNAYSIPQFNNFKMKLELINPSFSQDAGAPTLSSPAGSLMVLAAKSIIGMTSVFGRTVPYASEREAINEDLTKMFLGTMGKNVTWQSAVTPMLLMNFYRALDRREANTQFTSASMSAAAYLQAYGNGLPDDPNDKVAMAKAQRNMKIAAGNIMYMRFFLGLGPVSMSLQESKGLPDYFKEAGSTTLRGEFFKILQGIQETYGTSIQDPYALATAIFIGKNPGKSIYTISRSDKNYQVVVKMTNDMKNWTLDNKNFVDMYGDAAWLFSPKSGEFNSTVYTWMEAQDLINMPKFDAYLQRMAVSEDRDTYFKIGIEEEKQLAETQSLTMRKNIIDAASQARQSLLASNPLLADNLIGNAANRGGDLALYDNIKAIVIDKNSPIDKRDRAAMKQAIIQMDNFLAVAGQTSQYAQMPNYTELKQQAKQNAEAKLLELSNISPAVDQAYRFIFKSIMNSYVRDTAVVLNRR